jgi:hypothetical protein
VIAESSISQSNGCQIQNGPYESEFVKSEGLAAGSFDASAGSASEAQGSNAQLWDFEETEGIVSFMERSTASYSSNVPIVVGDSANNDDRLLCIGLVNNLDTWLDGSHNARDGQRRTCRKDPV